MDEFIHTLFLPVVERDLSYVEGMVDMMLGGMAEVASALNHEQSIIGVNVKEIQKGPLPNAVQHQTTLDILLKNLSIRRLSQLILIKRLMRHEYVQHSVEAASMSLIATRQ